MQRFVQQNAGMVTCERPPGSVGAVHAWCQTDDKQRWRGITKRRHGLAKISGVLRLYFAQKIGQTRTFAARGIIIFIVSSYFFHGFILLVELQFKQTLNKKGTENRALFV
jgi:hypothetical protein